MAVFLFLKGCRRQVEGLAGVHLMWLYAFYIRVQEKYNSTDGVSYVWVYLEICAPFCRMWQDMTLLDLCPYWTQQGIRDVHTSGTGGIG